MAASSNDARDVKLTALIKTMFERVPKEKRLTVEVVMQLLKAKYVDTFPAEYLADRTGLLAGLIDSFYSAESTGKRDSGENGNSKKNNNEGGEGGDDESDDDDDESDDDDDESDDDDDESGDGEEEDEDEDEAEEDEESDSAVADEAGGDDGGAPAAKRQRLEEGASDVARRCHEMVDCLRRLSYRVRKQEDGESSETYLQQYLLPLFQEKGLDPARYGKADVRHYRVKRELEQLQSDGADVNLDRATRAGRGLNRLPTAKDATINVRTSQFLDEE
ncbi:uncharacterized protein Tco025E_01435 [Trypanosoma conorhini]|uniref:Uncharacterized protein n=1 Tax=Trypanosoma conorhini TaxID=83891 RepID=A0A3R7LK75_9TRYP|nr:uncharacterized protein Tco025E_01435 [Trypanosoma conorhini]RNF26286.1 hypothetical protein Tco025E_01435 [Trypanosoma conorhini]